MRIIQLFFGVHPMYHKFAAVCGIDERMPDNGHGAMFSGFPILKVCVYVLLTKVVCIFVLFYPYREFDQV